nr:hypothetical protein GCM10017745_48110 [Saccharothrix mutabilis subsp. capreolus]
MQGLVAETVSTRPDDRHVGRCRPRADPARVDREADTSMRTALVLDALEMALWACGHTGHPIKAGLLLPKVQGTVGLRVVAGAPVGRGKSVW